MITLTCPPDHVIIGQLTVRCLKGGFYNDTIGQCRRVCPPPAVENADLQIYQPARVGGCDYAFSIKSEFNSNSKFHNLSICKCI